jgi:hypothetical protein
VKVNWACTAAGSANNSSSGSNFVAQAVLKRVAIVSGQIVLGSVASFSMAFGLSILSFMVVCWRGGPDPYLLLLERKVHFRDKASHSGADLLAFGFD